MSRLMASGGTQAGVITHAEHISLRTAAAYLSRARFLVLPYKEVTQSGVLGMSFAFGKPVISTNVGGLTDVVHNNENGLVVNPNAQELAAAMLRLWRDGALHRRLVQGTRATLTTLLDVDAIRTEWVRAYRDVLRDSLS
jgi:glycosyltransferase involved in cell wall biosynthesis